MGPAHEDQLLVWSFSDNDAYTHEGFDFYGPNSFRTLHYEVTQFIRCELENFCASFSESFNLAEFPNVREQLQPSEVAVFLNAAGAPDKTDLSSAENYDCFSGLRGVICHRLEQASLEQIKQAADLFNWTIERGLFLTDTRARAALRVGSVGDVAPFLLERILSRLPKIAEEKTASSQVPLTDFDRRFVPLLPLLIMLQETVEPADWVHNKLARKIFFWIAEMYQSEVESESA